MATRRNFTSNVSASPTRTIKNVKTIQAKSRTHEVTEIAPDSYQVVSGHSGSKYQVRIISASQSPLGTTHGGYCSCEWGGHRSNVDKRSGCSHVTAVYNHIAVSANRTVSAWGSKEDARRQHRPTLNIGDGVTLTARLEPAPILWIIQSQSQDQPQVLEVMI